MKSIQICLILFFIIFIISGKTLFGQDAHYWNLSYGTKSHLLGGAVIGSNSDLSATFYNPGMLGLKRDAELVLGARILELSNISVDSPNLNQLDLSSTKFKPSPTFAAGTFMSDSLKKNRFTYSLLTRQYFDFNLDGRYVDELNGIHQDSEIILKESMYETWGGVTWSHRVNNSFGIGVTQFFALRSEEQRVKIGKNELLPSDDLNSFQYNLYYNYYNVRTLWKLGVGYDDHIISVGLTVTTPSLNLFGSGEAYYSAVANGIISSTDENESNHFSADYQDDLTSRYKNSWAVGFGGAYRISKSRLHFSAEWFNALKNYNILDIEGFKSQYDQQLTDYNVVHQANSIINLGFGYELNIIEGISVYGSFTTDFSTIDPNSESNLNVATWDIYHIIGGSTFELMKSEITVGVEYAFGYHTGMNLFDGVKSNNLLISDLNGNADVKYKRIKLILVLQIDL